MLPTLAILMFLAIPYTQAVCTAEPPTTTTRPPPTVTTTMTRVCEWKYFNPTCAGGTIQIVSIFYGRNSITPSGSPQCGLADCAGTPSGALCSSNPVGVLNSSTCSLATIKPDLANACNGQATCNFQVTNGNMGGDPCGGIYKFAEITWTCTQP
jgi:Galactose binding lectin domain